MNIICEKQLMKDGIGDLKDFAEYDNGVTLYCENGVKHLIPYREGLLRIVVEGIDSEQQFEVEEINQPPAAFMLEEKDENLCLTTLDLHIVIQKSPLKITIHDRYEREMISQEIGDFLIDTDSISCIKKIPATYVKEVARLPKVFKKDWADVYIVDTINGKFGLLIHKNDLFINLKQVDTNIYQLNTKRKMLDYYILTEEVLDKIENMI